MANVLIVDDSLLQRRMLTAIVAEQGYDCEEAENGKIGLEKFVKAIPLASSGIC